MMPEVTIDKRTTDMLAQFLWRMQKPFDQLKATVHDDGSATLPIDSATYSRIEERAKFWHCSFEMAAILMIRHGCICGIHTQPSLREL